MACAAPVRPSYQVRQAQTPVANLVPVHHGYEIATRLAPVYNLIKPTIFGNRGCRAIRRIGSSGLHPAHFVSHLSIGVVLQTLPSQRSQEILR